MLSQTSAVANFLWTRLACLKESAAIDNDDSDSLI